MSIKNCKHRQGYNAVISTMCVNMVFDTSALVVVKSPKTGLDLSLGQFNVEKRRHISLLLVLLLLLLKVARNIS